MIAVVLRVTNKKWLLLMTVLILLFLLWQHRTLSLLFIQTSTNIVSDSVQLDASFKYGSTKKLILTWTKFFNVPFVTNYVTECPELPCEMTTDRTRLDESDGVVFHRDDLSWSDLPPRRLQRQRFVFFTHETPAYNANKELFNKLPGYFNWTMSIRYDSDVPYPYSQVIRQKSSEKLLKLESKSTTVSWLVSNCDTHSSRELIVREMQKYGQVQIYGKCGKLKCPENQYEKCLMHLSEQSWFYLSFENSVCHDYVSEKFWTVFRFDMVPVVLKRSIVEKYAPPNSFIAVDDFKDAQSLMEYLALLTRNETAYRQYFRWRTEFRVVFNQPGHYMGFCKLCDKLHRDNVEKIIPDLAKWWIGESRCDRYYGAKLVKRWGSRGV